MCLTSCSGIDASFSNHGEAETYWWAFSIPVDSPSRSELPLSDELQETPSFGAKLKHELLEKAGLLVLIYIGENIRKGRSCAQRLNGDSYFPGVCSRAAVFGAFVGIEGRGHD
jgi:hypothetical protein